MATENLRRFVAAMPKAELHVHLEGSIGFEVLRQLDRVGVETSVPLNCKQDFDQWLRFERSDDFFQKFVAVCELLRTPEDFELAVYELGAAMAAENIVYREVIVAPTVHVDYQQKVSMDELADGLEAGRIRAEKDFDVKIRWVYDIVRVLAFRDLAPGQSFDGRLAEKVLDAALKGQNRGVVGLGLGGNEVGAPAEPFRDIFAAAREAGLLSVPHAGETEGARSVRAAVEALSADRIGHGIRAAEDDSVLALLAHRQVPLDICLTSNRCLGVWQRIEEHPIKLLDRAGCFTTINSDDPALFNTSLTDEYVLLASHLGFSADEIHRLARQAWVASTVDADFKQRQLDKLDAVEVPCDLS